MKNRRIAAKLAIGLSVTIGLASTLQVPAIAAEATMAEISEPQFEALPAPIGTDSSSDRFYLALEGLGQGVEVKSVKIKNKGELSDYAWDDPQLTAHGDQISFTMRGRYEKNFDRTYDFVAVYNDGSVDNFTQTFRFVPADRYRYVPSFENGWIAAGERVTNKIVGVPDGTRFNIVSSSEGWDFDLAEGANVTVQSPATPPPGEDWSCGDLTMSVIYPDKTTEIAGLTLCAMGESLVETTAESPSPTSEQIENPGNSSVENTTETVTEVVTVTSVSPTTVTEKKPAPVTTTVTETVSVPTTVTVNTTATPVVTTVTATQAASAPSTVTVTQDEPQSATVTRTVTVTDDLKQARPVTETVTASSVVRVTRTVTEKPLAPVTVTAAPEAPRTVTVPPATKTVTAAPEAPQTVTVTQAPKAEEKNGSSTGSIIALVIGLLGLIGGIGAALVGNPQLRAALPF